jgi:hypothetical protein
VYRRRRLAAAGTAFPCYEAALRRLQAVLTSPGTGFREVMLSLLQDGGADDAPLAERR